MSCRCTPTKVSWDRYGSSLREDLINDEDSWRTSTKGVIEVDVGIRWGMVVMVLSSVKDVWTSSSRYETVLTWEDVWWTPGTGDRSKMWWSFITQCLREISLDFVSDSPKPLLLGESSGTQGSKRLEGIENGRWRSRESKENMGKIINSVVSYRLERNILLYFLTTTYSILDTQKRKEQFKI